MAEDVDFVTVGPLWLHGRSDFERYHTRLLAGRFKNVTCTNLQTLVRFLSRNFAVVHWTWALRGDRNVDGTARQPRFGMTSNPWFLFPVRTRSSDSERFRQRHNDIGRARSARAVEGWLQKNPFAHSLYQAIIAGCNRSRPSSVPPETGPASWSKPFSPSRCNQRPACPWWWFTVTPARWRRSTKLSPEMALGSGPRYCTRMTLGASEGIR